MREVAPAPQKYPAAHGPLQVEEVSPAEAPYRPAGQGLAVPNAQYDPGAHWATEKNTPVWVGMAKEPLGVGRGDDDPAGQNHDGSRHALLTLSRPVPVGHAKPAGHTSQVTAPKAGE